MFKSFLAALLFTSAICAPGARAAAPCASGQSEISVEGVNGIFCVQGSTICAADISQGACPAVQEGLTYGSYCGKVASGVYGCKVLDSESVKTFQPWVEPGSVAASTPAPTTAVAVTPEPATPEPTTAATTPEPTTAATTPEPTTAAVTAAVTPAPTTLAPTTAAAVTPAPTAAATVATPAPTGATCAQGTLVSVEGVNGVFCVTNSPVCAANLSTGACPGVQAGLPNGSYCGKVASGVYGCKVQTSSTSTSTPAATPVPATASPAVTSIMPTTPAPTTTTPTVSTSATPVPSITSSIAPSTGTSTGVSTNVDCPSGGSPMSIEGVKKIFCVTGVACAADIASGNCPGKQEGLPFGSFCDVVHTGVYGCRAYVDENIKPASGMTAPHNCTGNAAGSTPVSIVGATRDFCAQEPICSGNRYGNCPGAQDGLDKTTSCVIISTGVFGCVFK